METPALPQAIARYIELGNGTDIDAIAACFTSDATVVDEEKTYQGTAEIGAWARGTREQYEFQSVPTSSEEEGEATLVTCHVTGNFPGSPVDLRYAFRLQGDKIASLEIVG